METDVKIPVPTREGVHTYNIGISFSLTDEKSQQNHGGEKIVLQLMLKNPYARGIPDEFTMKVAPHEIAHVFRKYDPSYHVTVVGVES